VLQTCFICPSCLRKGTFFLRPYLPTTILDYFQVFLEYADTEGSSKARAGMNGRKFDGNQVVAVFYPENRFSQGEYDD